jgi:hypothetical protein
MQQIRRSVEWHVRNDSERLSRQRKDAGVAFDHVDVLPSATESRCQVRIEFDGEHVTRHSGELSGEPSATSAKVQHEIVCTNARIANQLRG